MNETLKIIIAAEVDKLKKNINDAKTSIKDFVKEGTKDFDKLNEEFQKYGEASKKGLKMTAGALVGVSTALVALGPATEQYRTTQAKLISGFEAAGSSAEQAKNTYNDLYRVLGDGDQATEAANHLAQLTTEEKALSEWTNICQGVYATFGDSLPIESLTEAANETAKTGALTGGLTDALNWAGIAEEEFQAKLDACNTEAEREALIRETLNGVYDDASKKYEVNAAGVLAQNEAQAKLSETTAKLGEAIAPVQTMLTELATEVLAQLTPYITDFLEKHGPKLEEIIGKVAKVVGEVISWIADNWDLVSTLAGIILGIAAAISVVSTVMSVVNAVMLASPVSWVVLGIVAAIAALVAITVLIIKNWDTIKATASKIWNGIKDTISKAIDGAKTAVGNAIEKIKGFFKFEWSLPKLKLPTFKITGKLDLLTIPPKVPKLSISWNALGGVFDKPTLFSSGYGFQGIGEDGAEAVVPLEKNTQWLDRIAQMLIEKQGTTPIILQVDGKTFAQVSIDSINQLTRQRGTLALNIV